MKNDRREALDSIIAVLEQKEYMPKGKSGYQGRVIRGVVERAIELDSRLATISSMKIKRMHPVVRNVLRLGAYEILYMDSIPTSATVNEMVKLAKKKGQYKASGMVNAILRKVKDTTSENIPDKYSMPKWLYEKLHKAYPNDVENICSTFLESKPLTLRINNSHVDAINWAESAKDAGLEITEIFEGVYSVKGYSSIEEIPGYGKGFWYIQNPSSAMVGFLSGIKNKMQVLDMCAAPGGKSIHAADLVGVEGSVESRDVSEQKVNLISENIKASGFMNMHTKVWDATVFDKDSVEKFDVVISDVPCSGVGVLAKKPEIKYRLTQNDINSLAGIQKQILNNAAEYVKSKGRLIYSTCTIFEEENSGQIKQFLKEHSQFKVIEEKQILPHDIWDGFYICVMEKS